MKTFFIIPFILLSTFVFAQDCGCTIQQVEANQVESCTVTIGTVVNVATVSELRAAILQANQSGGNMTILIADGTYPIASTSSYPYITASNLVIRSASGNRDAVIISGQGMKAVNGTEIGLSLQGDNITVADLTVREVGNHGISMNSDNHLIHNVRIQNTFEQMIKGTSSDGGSDNCIVQCSLFEYPAGVGPQFYIGGLDIHDGDGWTVRDNIFKNIASPSGSLAEHAVHFWNNSSNNIVERNLMYNCDRGIGFGLGSSPSQGGIIRNNMITNDGSGNFNDVGIGLESSPNTQVYNNTIFITYQNAIEYRFASTSNVDIQNNITNRQIRSRNDGSGNVAHNVTNAESSWFMNVGSGNLRLASAISEVVDQGASLAVSDDIDQKSRPQGGGIDIGAFEFEGTTVADEDNDGFSAEIDCDDNDASINPDAEEIPNNDVDENCDGVAEVIDNDNDGFNSDEDCDDNNADINPNEIEIPNNDVDEDCDGVAQIIDNDNDGFNSDDDCDDEDPAINPGAEEIPNNDIDENCDGETQIVDADNDGFDNDLDCDDGNAAINPDAVEIPNNDVDEDCDGVAQIIDNDNDGFHSDDDCDDEDPAINPGAEEIPNNDIDENCDGETQIVDADNDGFNNDLDCDDGNAAINPDALEIPNNDVDEDCDGVAQIIDKDNDGFNSDDDCDDEDPAINPGAEEIPNNDIDENCDGETQIVDADNDGFNNDQDCDDGNAAINPDAVEIPNNDVDEDCDGVAQIIDNDNDGFNSDDDCDDENAAINPGAEEVPNNDIDENCDGEVMTSSTKEIDQVEVEIYPNPSSGYIYLSYDSKIDLEIEILNSTGLKLRSVHNSNIIDLSELSSGLYFVKLTDRITRELSIKKIILTSK